MARSRSRSPRRERKRSTSREKERRRRDRPKSRSRSPKRRYRSRSRSPRRRRSLSPRKRSRSKSSSPGPSEKCGSESPKPLKFEREKLDEKTLETMSEEDQEMYKLMGFVNFDTTKGKRTEESTNLADVQILEKRKYRQYMNRKGGFNRPLDYVA